MKQKYIKDDIVYIDGSIRTIKQSDDYYATFYNDNIKWQEVKNVNDIKGIPITPEILEKNGWELRKHHKRQNYDDVEYYEYHNPSLVSIQLRYYVEEKTFYPFCYNNEIEVKGGNAINWLHQLQHLLFGLGLDSKIIV